MLNLLFLVYFLHITLFNLNISHEIAKPTQSKYYFATTRAVVLKTILPTLKQHVLRQHLMVDIKPKFLPFHTKQDTHVRCLCSIEHNFLFLYFYVQVQVIKILVK